MTRTISTIYIFLGLIHVLLGVATAAPTDAQKCAKLKLAAAGRYANCRLAADAKEIKSGKPADYAMCDAKLDADFARAEAMFECSVTQDVEEVSAFVADITRALARQTIGGALPSCTSGCPAGEVAAVGSSACQPCPDNAEPDAFSRTCLCSSGYYLEDTECLACPEGGDCTVPGATCATMQPLPGYWRSDPASCIFYPCLIRSQSRGVTRWLIGQGIEKDRSYHS